MTSEATKVMISITANTSISVKPDLGLVLHIRGVCCGAGPSPPANGTDQDCPAAASALILLRCGYDRGFRLRCSGRSQGCPRVRPGIVDPVLSLFQTLLSVIYMV